MANTSYGAEISGTDPQLTCYADAVLSVGQPVEIVGNYKVAVPVAQASINVIGYVKVANKAAAGDLTVCARGNSVKTVTACASGVSVGAVVVNADGTYRNYDASYPGGGDTCCAVVGIALTSASGGGLFDMLQV
jgi:hypothetical protein